MIHPFEHPAAKRLLERVASHFNERPIYLLPQNKLVFVCGGPDNNVSTRSKFLKWAKFNLPDFRFFLAEAAAKDIVSEPVPQFLNLAKFEKVLADVADVLLIFPESVGSWAETGFFSAMPPFQKKCLIVNSSSEQGESFLNVGPIQTINETSVFRSTIYIDVKDEQIDFKHVAEKLRRYEGSRKARIQNRNFSQMTGQQQIAFLFYLIQIFPSLNLDGIIFLIKSAGFNYKKSRIAELISILISADQVRRAGSDQTLFVANRDLTPLLEIEGISENRLLAEHLEYFQKYAQSFLPKEEVASC